MHPSDLPIAVRREICFVRSALLAGALTDIEIAGWALRKVQELETPPLELIDLLDADKLLRYEIVEIFCGRPMRALRELPTDLERRAIHGVVLARGMWDESYDHTISKPTARRALEQQPQIAKEFRQYFPEIEW